MNVLKSILYILIASVQFSFAQQATIRGTIKDQQSNEPVAYASIALLNAKDSSVVAGVISGENGTFELRQVEPGRYPLLLMLTLGLALKPWLLLKTFLPLAQLLYVTLMFPN